MRNLETILQKAEQHVIHYIKQHQSQKYTKHKTKTTQQVFYIYDKHIDTELKHLDKKMKQIIPEQLRYFIIEATIIKKDKASYTLKINSINNNIIYNNILLYNKLANYIYTNYNLAKNYCNKLNHIKYY